MNREEKSRYVADVTQCSYIAVILDDLDSNSEEKESESEGSLRFFLKKGLREALSQKRDEERKCKAEGDEFCGAASAPSSSDVSSSPYLGLIVDGLSGGSGGDGDGDGGGDGGVVEVVRYTVKAASKVLDSARSTSALLRAFYVPGLSESANRMKDYLILKKIEKWENL
jgi:hypothetical protein